MIGIYPYVNGIGGVPLGHPGRWISGRLAAGMPLIVIDPRETNVAKRATIYLQPRPGHDVAILGLVLEAHAIGHARAAAGLHEHAKAELSLALLGQDIPELGSGGVGHRNEWGLGIEHFLGHVCT